ncbi:hypothetical protein [Streptomyces sulphureus]|uniref:hypothetical protein n=1 Tax=Streptomyces sulphureus TaxID=47758 RepID=UPI0003755D9F|nr:hypothetical protein [Streptomyces sulphureus]
MNIRSLTRGDGAVAAAAVLLFIASFLNFYTADDCGESCSDLPSAWDTDMVTVILPAVYLLGIIAAVLVVLGRLMQQDVKFATLSLGQWGVPLAVAAFWSSFWSLVLKPDASGLSLGAGAWLGFLANLVIAGFALATPLVPALRTPLIPAGGPKQPQMGQMPYGQQPGGYGYPGAPQQGQPGPYGQQPYGQQPQPGAPQPQDMGAAQPFQPFWFAVPVARPLFPEDGSPQPVAELTPGTWFLAVDQRGQALIAQTQDGRRGILQDTSGIQRG